MKPKKGLLAFVFLAFSLFPTEAPSSPISSTSDLNETKITIDVASDIGNVNKRVLGNNIIGHVFDTPESLPDYKGDTDFGEGIWDPKRGEPVAEVIGLAKEAGVSIARLHGGGGIHQYNWKEAVGPREEFLFGIDESLRVCAEIGCEVIITVRYWADEEAGEDPDELVKDAADLVEYLNTPNDGSNPNGEIDWAAERAKNGHPEPYGVKYFEIGNETWHRGDHDFSKGGIGGDEYGTGYLKFYAAMKAVDPSIALGNVTFSQDWNRDLMEVIKDKSDFVIFHTFPSPSLNENDFKGKTAKEIYEITYARIVVVDEFFLEEAAKLAFEESGKNIPFIISEYNGGFNMQEPIPYRHCLGNALLNAELIRIFMKPQYNVLAANYWNLVNEFWGMMYAGADWLNHNYPDPILYIKRPNYYVYELYHKHFGEILINPEVQSETYRISEEAFEPLKSFIGWAIHEEGVSYPEPQIPDVPYLTVNASRDIKGDKVYLMVINRNMDESITATIELKSFVPAQKGKAWILNGPSVDATNEYNVEPFDPFNVGVRQEEIIIESNIFEYTFEPHSVTAIEIEKDELAVIIQTIQLIEDETQLEIRFKLESLENGPIPSLILQESTTLIGPFTEVSGLSAEDLGGGEFRFIYTLNTSDRKHFFRIKAQR